MRGSAGLHGMKKNNRKAEPQPAFLKVEPRATRPDSCPLPVARSSATAARARGFALLSRKLGCGVDTKCPDIHPKPGGLESNSTSALRRQEPALHRQGLA